MFSVVIMEKLNKLDQMISKLDSVAKKKLNDSLRLSYDEMLMLQNRQSVKHAGGKLPLELASFCYQKLGGDNLSAKVWEENSISEKILVVALLK